MLLLGVATTNAETIVAWNFNSQQPDDTTTTGTTAPSNRGRNGNAHRWESQLSSAVVIRTQILAVEPTIRVGIPAGIPQSKPGVGPRGSNSVPGPPGTNTLLLKWSQRNSATASRYCRLQYSVNGRDFLDAQVVEVVADSVFLESSVDLSPYGGTADNPLFAWRLVTEFESAAVGSGAAAYIATRVGSTYSSNGTIRLDSVRVEGGRIAGGNLPPSITSVADQAVRLGEWTPTLNVTVGDTEDLPTKLSLSGESSDASIIAEVVVAGTGATRTVRVHAAPSRAEPPSRCW
jgi:hypothetical protein